MGDVIEILTTATNTVEVEAQGPQGIPGVGVPTGGSTGQVLRKASGANYDTEWAAAGSGSGSVTSVALASSDFTISGSPITDAGTITANLGNSGVTAGTYTKVTVDAKGRVTTGATATASDIGAAPATGIDPAAISGTAVVDSDARLSDSRTPTAHAASHAAGTKASYTGIGVNETLETEVTIRANTVGTAGNSITLTFDGVDDVATSLAAWNSANPSNQATLLSGDGAQVPAENEQITLYGGVNGGSDPFKNINQDLGTTDTPEFSGLVINGTDTGGGDIRLKGKTFFGTADGATGVLVESTSIFPENTFGFTGVNQAVTQYRPLGFTGNGSQQLYLATDGNVGVGTASPNAKLDINGNVIIRDEVNEFSATLDAQDTLTGNQTLTLPDASGVLVVDSQLGAVATSNSYDDLNDLPTLGTAAAADIGSTAGTVCAGDDARLSDARTPSSTLAHKTSHATGGTDALSAADIGAAASSHSHGNLTSDGKVGSTAGLPLVTTTAGAVTTLALGTANQVLRVNSGATGVEFGTVSSGDTVSIDSTAADILSATSGAISADDAGADRIVYWNNTSNKLEYGTPANVGAAAASHTHAASDIASGTIDTARLGSGTANNTTYLRGDQTWATVSAGVSGSTGATDNSVLRSDGTGSSALQASGLVIEDAVISFTGITGDASTDIVTATGSAFSNGQKVRFTALTGGSGLNTTTNYYVISVSGATFQLSTTEGGSAVNFTTNITAGTLLTGHSVDPHVAIANASTNTNSCLWLKTKGTGAFIVDGSGSLASARGASAIDIQPDRGTSTTKVASGGNSIAIGDSLTSSNTRSVCIGSNNTASGVYGTCVGGYNSTASGRNSVVLGSDGALADRAGMRAFSNWGISGQRQEVQFFLVATTTNNSATEMFIDGQLSTRLTIPSGRVMGGILSVVGSKSDGSAVALYSRQLVIKNVGGTTTLPSVSTIGTDYEDNANTDILVEANDTNDALRVYVYGITGENWRWTGFFHGTEHVYGT